MFAEISTDSAHATIGATDDGRTIGTVPFGPVPRNTPIIERIGRAAKAIAAAGYRVDGVWTESEGGNGDVWHVEVSAPLADVALSASVNDTTDLTGLPVLIVGADLVRLLADFAEVTHTCGTLDRATLETSAQSIAAARGYLPPVGEIGTVSA